MTARSKPTAPPKSAAGAPTSESLPIRAVSRLTGLSADTLRIWERRYGFPRPIRTAKGARLFSEADVERLHLVVRALRWGYRPGEVVARERAALAALLARPFAPQPADDLSPLVSPLLEAVRRADLPAMAAGLRSAVANLGVKPFVTRVVTPLLDKVGEAWSRGEIGIRHEHLLSEALTSRIRTLLSTYAQEEGGPRILLATLPGETHTMGLQLAALYLAVEGFVPRLVGAETPTAEITAAALTLDADLVGISMSPRSDPRPALEQARRIAAQLPERAEVWLGGRVSAQIESGDERIRPVPGWAEADREIARYRPLWERRRARRAKAPATGRPTSRGAAAAR